MSAITVRLDPTAAKHYLLLRRGIPSCACGVTWPTDRFLGITEHLVESNAPAVEAQVRAQVAAQIEDYTDAVLDLVDTQNGARLAFIEIIRIARDGRP